MKSIIDDGFNPELVETAFFDGIIEMPKIAPVKEDIIPTNMVPYSKRNYSENEGDFIAFYEYDIKFADVLRNPDSFLKESEKFAGIITLDCSLYLDSPLIVQMANVYRSRAIGHYCQDAGRVVIPNVRWGDERSYTTKVLPFKFAFLGLPENSILSIGTYGCIQTREEKYHIEAGLESLLEEKTPRIVLVYGPMPDKIFGKYDSLTKFINYPDWTSLKKSKDW